MLFVHILGWISVQDHSPAEKVEKPEVDSIAVSLQSSSSLSTDGTIFSRGCQSNYETIVLSSTQLSRDGFSVEDVPPRSNPMDTLSLTEESSWISYEERGNEVQSEEAWQHSSGDADADCDWQNMIEPEDQLTDVKPEISLLQHNLEVREMDSRVYNRGFVIDEPSNFQGTRLSSPAKPNLAQPKPASFHVESNVDLVMCTLCFK